MRGDIAKFSVAVSEQVIKHKKKIIEQQVLLNRVADVAILLQSMAAVISRSNTMADKVICFIMNEFSVSYSSATEKCPQNSYRDMGSFTYYVINILIA